MIVENVLHVLRMPDAPNAYYHAACYQGGGSEIVLQVYRLIRDVQCAGCHEMVSEPRAKVEQLSLFG